MQHFQCHYSTTTFIYCHFLWKRAKHRGWNINLYLWSCKCTLSLSILIEILKDQIKLALSFLLCLHYKKVLDYFSIFINDKYYSYLGTFFKPCHSWCGPYKKCFERFEEDFFNQAHLDLWQENEVLVLFLSLAQLFDHHRFPHFVTPIPYPLRHSFRQCAKMCGADNIIRDDRILRNSCLSQKKHDMNQLHIEGCKKPNKNLFYFC